MDFLSPFLSLLQAPGLLPPGPDVIGILADPGVIHYRRKITEEGSSFKQPAIG
jgi:hypothetical protein